MSYDNLNIEFAYRRYRDLVRTGERRALRLAQVEPQAEMSGGLVRKAAAWLGRQRVNLSRDLLPGAVVVHGEQASR